MIKMEKITKKMILGEIVSKYPNSIEVFIKHGLHCAGCGMAYSETVEEAAQMHGIKLDKLLKDLNKAAAKKK